MPLPPRNVFLGFALATGWIALVIAASIVYRRIKGKPIFRRPIEHPLFLETWRSGRSLRSLVARFGGARNCLWVAVTGDSLRVGPYFPFNLMFLPEIYGLECTIPGSAVRSVARAGGVPGRRPRPRELRAHYGGGGTVRVLPAGSGGVSKGRRGDPGRRRERPGDG